MTKRFTVFVVGLFIAVATLICFSTLTKPKQNASFKILTGIGIFVLGFVDYGLF
ncbi:hypothetical protein [Bacillus sp. BB56-3]|uniref:hypothetical protein n=1 Tax=Bacillus sp. BB56-3 TaxID=2217831 RepID=UPI0015D1D67D|nr:hypothetical protein [Bacillus sp. BB56-3]